MRHLKRIVPSTLYIRRAIFTLLVKRVCFALLGIAFITVPVIAMIYGLIHADKSETTIGSVILSTAIGLLVGFLMVIIGALIDNNFVGMTIFIAFFRVSLQNRKRLYHSTMGEFELIIDEKNLEGTLVKQGFFSCTEIAIFDLNKYSLMENIKQYLDARYKDEIAEIKERKRKRELVEGLMKKEGYLDVVGKRDDKISKLGIK